MQTDATLVRRATTLAARADRAGEDLDAMTTELQDALRRPGRQDAAATAQVGRALVEITRLQAELRQQAVSQRFETVARIHQSLARLRRLETLGELLTGAAEELGRCCGFDRTVISRRRGSTWRAEAIWLTPEIDPVVAAETRAYLTDHWIPLRPGTLENDLVHRRTAAIISATDDRVDRELVTATHSSAYVASPVMPSGDVIGFLQVDCQISGRELTDADRDNLWTFAQGFGLIFEHLALLERVQEQRTHVQEAFAAAEAGLAELTDAERLLGRRSDELDQALTSVPVGASRLDLLLSAREREVLDLMAEGARNLEIAERLVIGESTVKSHVRRISQKLHAANRADAVSRYLRMRHREQA